MGKYLKMADVFGTGVEPKQLSGWKHQGRYVEPKKIQEAAAHAINSHDELVAEVERLRNSLLQCVEALYIAHKFCGNHTADECGDEIAIPISDALVAASKLVAP